MRGRRNSWLTGNLVLIAAVSLTTDMAGDLLYPLLPILLTVIIGAPPFALGLVEGLANATAGFANYFAGKLSDKYGRKRFIVLGYNLAGVGKLAVIFATGWPLFYVGRILDRLGKGMRGTARDALINDSVGKKDLGKAYGFHRSGDNLGAFIGPLLAILGLWALHGNVRAVAKWAIIPAVISGILTLFIREMPKSPIMSDESRLKSNGTVKLSPELVRAIIVLVLIGLTNIPTTLMLLRLHDLGISTSYVVLAYACANLVTVLAAYPAGKMADKFSARVIYPIGLLAFAIALLALGLTTSKLIAFLTFGVYGLFAALTDGVGAAWIASLATEKVHGRAQGVYQSTMNFAVLGAGIWGGALWTHKGTELPLIIAAVTALIGGLYIVVTPTRHSL